MDKEWMVQKMFSSAARRYDLNNTVLSFGVHHYWKRYAVERSAAKRGSMVLDVCSGTADMAILLARRVASKGRVMAVDLNQKMLEIGKKKVIKSGLEDIIYCSIGNAESLQFRDNMFDAVTVGFGVRNVKCLDKTFAEMYRVTRPGGRVVCLEFTQPEGRLFKYLYDFYSFTVIPAIGTVISRDKTGIYNYLPSSIRKFPSPELLKQLMYNTGFSEVYYNLLSGGIVALHVGIK